MIRVPQGHQQKTLGNETITLCLIHYWLSSLQQESRMKSRDVKLSETVLCPESPCLRCQMSFKFYLFCSIPVSGWCRLEEFLHEDLKIVGCKIKRYFKMCLPVFIGSIKASFGSAFWPPWSGGHFYNQSSKHDESSELSELETNFVVAGVGRDLTDHNRYLI